MGRSCKQWSWLLTLYGGRNGLRLWPTMVKGLLGWWEYERNRIERLETRNSGTEACEWDKGSEHKACRSLSPHINAHQGGGTQHQDDRMLAPWMLVTPVLTEWAFVMEAGPDSTDSILLRLIQLLPQPSAQTASSSTNYTKSSAGIPWGNQPLKAGWLYHSPFVKLIIIILGMGSHCQTSGPMSAQHPRIYRMPDSPAWDLTRYFRPIF